MLTASDIKKLKEILVTKEDLKELRDGMVATYATKSDLSRVSGDLMDLIYSFRQELKDDIVEIKEEITSFRKEVSSILQNHEHRVTSLEDQSYS